MKMQHWQDWVNLLLGVAALFSALYFIGDGTSSAVIVNYFIVGFGVTIFAIFALVAFEPWQEWVNLVFGAWLLVSPWVLGFSAVTALMLNTVRIGVLIIMCAGWVLGKEQVGKPITK